MGRHDAGEDTPRRAAGRPDAGSDEMTNAVYRDGVARGARARAATSASLVAAPRPAPVAAARAAPHANLSPGPTTTPYRRVLLVEDEATLRRVIARNLAGRGLLVREAETAAEALQALRAEAPDLLLLDINLPDRTGWDILRDLRERGAEVPTIVVSAVRVSQSRLAEFHPLAYLPKPFPLEALLRLVFGAPPAGSASSGEDP